MIIPASSRGLFRQKKGLQLALEPPRRSGHCRVCARTAGLGADPTRPAHP